MHIGHSTAAQPGRAWTCWPLVRCCPALGACAAVQAQADTWQADQAGRVAKANCACCHSGLRKRRVRMQRGCSLCQAFMGHMPPSCDALSQPKGLSCFAGMVAEARAHPAPVQPLTRCCACSTAWLWSGWSTGSQTRPRRGGWLPQWLDMQHRQAGPVGWGILPGIVLPGLSCREHVHFQVTAITLHTLSAWWCCTGRQAAPRCETLVDSGQPLCLHGGGGGLA